MVEIIPLGRVVSRTDIECPGDIIPYNCSIQSNSETIHLTWRVSIPGLSPINITYSNTTNAVTNLTGYITSSVMGFRSDEFIYSSLEVTVQPEIPTEQIVLECLIDDLGNATTVVFVNISSKQYFCRMVRFL